MSKVACALSVLLLAVSVRPTAQSPSPLAADKPYASGATAILVDVVVRDRGGQPMTDLAVEDFEIAEDGVPQRIDSFTRVTRGSGIGVGIGWRTPDRTLAVVRDARDDADRAADGTEATTALVFDHLSSESLRLAQRATLDHIPLSGESTARIGVFATGPGFRIVEPYTTDRTRVRQAVARVMPAGTSAEDVRTERTDELLAQRRGLQSERDAAAASVVAGSGAVLAANASELGQRESALRLIQTELNMLRSFDHMDRDNRGYDTTLALLSVVQSLSGLPGRKTVVFFSEGLPASPALSARLDHVIDVANRANVTAYAIDAKGLRARSTLTETRKEMEVFAEERLQQLATGSERTDRPLTMAFERVEDTLRLDSRVGLARLASDTGGVLIEGSNDLSSAFRRIDEDSRFHYLLTYSPTNTDFDGSFRTIQVKVRRSGAKVFARRGYRGIRTPAGINPGGYELPAIALLDRTPLPNAFPVYAAGFSFPDPSRPGLMPVLLRVRTGVLRFRVDPERSTYSAQAAVVIRLKDADGREVETLSQQYLLAGDASEVEAAKNGDILFYREVVLPPGVYTMESIVFDPAAARASARLATLTVAAADRLAMSSLLLVNRVEEVDDPPPSATAPPLYAGRMLLYPNLGEPIRKAATEELPFFFTLYGPVRHLAVEASLLSGGRPLASAPVSLSAGPGPHTQHVGRLPIGDLPAGTYELRIRVTHEGGEIVRTAFFTLQE